VTPRTARGHLGEDAQSAKALNPSIQGRQRSQKFDVPSGLALSSEGHHVRGAASRSHRDMAEELAPQLSTPLRKRRRTTCNKESDDLDRGDERIGDHHGVISRKDGDGSTLSSRPGKKAKKEAIESDLHPETKEQKGCSTAYYEAPPTRELVDQQFGDLPWRIGRPICEGRTLDGVPRLSEICMHSAKRLAASGRLGDLDCLPDEILVKLLAGASTDALVDLEARHPERIVVIDACWARISDDAALPVGFTRWRDLVQHAMTEKQMRQDEAGARLRKRYQAEEVSTQSRAVSATELVVGPSPGRRRHRGLSGVSSNGQPMTPLERLRMRVRRQRSVGATSKNGSVYGR
jgi:hypothetical protein